MDNNLELDEKISSILNMNLYQRFLTLLNTIGSQLTMIKNNSDILFTLSKDSLSIIEKLKKLDELFKDKKYVELAEEKFGFTIR